MLKTFKTLILTIAICKPAFADFEYNLTYSIGEASIEVMQNSGIITINNFMRKNKTINMSYKKSLCELPSLAQMAGYEIETLEKVFTRSDFTKADIEKFKKVGFVNVDCGSDNFIIQAMKKNPGTLEAWIKYGFDLNRPLQFAGKVGTIKDVAEYLMNKYQKENNDVEYRKWRVYYGKFRRGGYLNCKEQKIKCSIDFN